MHSQHCKFHTSEKQITLGCIMETLSDASSELRQALQKAIQYLSLPYQSSILQAARAAAATLPVERKQAPVHSKQHHTEFEEILSRRLSLLLVQSSLH